MPEIERRPDSRGVSAQSYPESWGAPPTGRKARAEWMKRNIERGMEQRAQGASIPWLKSEVEHR
jgi:hypothetical protein